MTEHAKHKNLSQASSFQVRRALLFVCILLGVAALVLIASPRPQPSFASLEAGFLDASASGLQIVPASCPSTPDYEGQCSEPIPPPPPSGSGCVITATPDTVSSDQETVLSWNTSNGPLFSVPSGTSIDQGVGPVDASGYRAVTPMVTKTYTLSGSWAVPIIGLSVGSFSCSTTVTVNACPLGYVSTPTGCVFSACPSGYVLQGSQCVLGACPSGYVRIGNQCVLQQCTRLCSGSNLVNSCTGALLQACAYGCSAGGCVAPLPPSILTWDVRPILVQSGTSVRVTWAAENVLSCTVRGTNGDGSGSNATGLWNTTSGDMTTTPIIAQTVYSITCPGFAGASPPSATRSTTVNIVPTFQEQ